MRTYFYPAKVHGHLNDRTFRPEAIDLRAMVNPHYPCLVDRERDPEGPPLLPGTRAISDSGAFQERDMINRLEPDAALDRQLALERRLRSEGCGPDFYLEAVVTYDMLVGVDEALQVDEKRTAWATLLGVAPTAKPRVAQAAAIRLACGNVAMAQDVVSEWARKNAVKRVKRRGNEETAAPAVAETIRSAEAYFKRRDQVAGAVAYSAQGASVRQYMACVRAMFDLIRADRDWLAMGGFCIIGMVPQLKPLFVAVCRELAPLARRKRVRRVHVLGVCVDDCLTVAAAEFAKEGVEFSTDSSSMEVNSVMGRVWREEHRHRRPGRSGPWVEQFSKEDKISGAYHPRDLAMENIERFSRWCRTLGAESKPLRQIPPFQQPLDLEGVAGLEALA